RPSPPQPSSPGLPPSHRERREKENPHASPLCTNSSYCSAFMRLLRSAAEEKRSLISQPSPCGSSLSSSGSSTTASLTSTTSPATGVYTSATALTDSMVPSSSL